MAMGLMVGGIFLGAVGSKAVRNYFSTEDDTKSPVADVQRKHGVTERIMANPHLLAQYNEKYIAQKIQNNSAMNMEKEKIQITRRQSLQQSANTIEEREGHKTFVRKMSTPSMMKLTAVMGA